MPASPDGGLASPGSVTPAAMDDDVPLAFVLGSLKRRPVRRGPHLRAGGLRIDTVWEAAPSPGANAHSRGELRR